MLTAGGRTQTWDFDGRLDTINGTGGLLVMAYDYTGIRIKKDGPGGIAYFPFSGFEIDPSGVITKYIRMGNDNLVSKKSTGEKLFYHNDHLGGVNVTTNDQGLLAQVVEYDPWGKVSRDDGVGDSVRRFTGKELDQESGIYYYGGRYYDPDLGRFISPDPIVQDPADPQTFNRYSYVRNNPFNLIDPSGHSFLKELFGAIGSFFRGLFGSSSSSGSGQVEGTTQSSESVRSRMRRQGIGGNPDSPVTAVQYETRLIGPTTHLKCNEDNTCVISSAWASRDGPTGSMGFVKRAVDVGDPRVAAALGDINPGIQSPWVDPIDIFSGSLVGGTLRNLGSGIVRSGVRRFTSTSVGRIYNVPGVGNLDLTSRGVASLLTKNLTRLKSKLGTKIGQGRLPFERSRAGFEDALSVVDRTLRNPSDVVGSFTSAQGKNTVIDVFSRETGFAVRMRADGTFDTLINGPTSRVRP